MIEQTPHALHGAMLSTMGLVAQVTTPIPDDFRTWPITAILGLISLGCLSIVAYQIRGTIKTADALAKVAERQTSAETDIKELTSEVRQLVLALNRRPCIANER